MPEPPAPDREARPTGRRRRRLLLAGALVLLVFGISLVKAYEQASKANYAETAQSALDVDVGGQPPSVMQLRATNKRAREENIQWLLMLDQEVDVDVRAPSKWLRQRMVELGRKDLDPSDKVTLDTVVYDPETEKEYYEKRNKLLKEREAIRVERERVKALPNGSQKKQASSALEQRQASLTEEADQLLLDRRNSAWEQAVMGWLERSCLVVDGRIFRDLNPQAAYPWEEWSKEEKRRKEHGSDKYMTLRFKIALTEANKQQWLELLGGTGLASKPVGVSIAMVDFFEKDKAEIMPTAINPSFAHPHEWQRVSLKASTDWLTWSLLGCFFLLFFLFLYCAFATKILQDLAPDGFWHLALGRCQMAFWFWPFAILSG